MHSQRTSIVCGDLTGSACDLSLQGALISLQNMPQLQSELQVTMETPSADGVQSMRLRGYVVRIDAAAEKGHSAVGVVFTD